MSTAATPPAEPGSAGVSSGGAAVIGAGLMGHGIAVVLAQAGLDVSVYDPDDAARETLPDRAAEQLRVLGRDPGEARRIRATAELAEATADVAWVFEAAPEKLELKQDLFARLDQLAPPTAILATNTSVISVGAIASRATGRHRIVGTHWWNPPFLIPLVEVVQTAETDPQVVDRTIEFLTWLGKTPVHVRRDVAGFVGNRLQHALWREALNLVEEGVCDAETIDIVVKSGFGLRLPQLGPMENADLIGLDLTLDIHEYVLPRLAPPSQPSALLREYVRQGRCGMKSGAGLREWTPENADQVRAALGAYLARVTQAGR
jgi:3-hydroxybutyryl-CoA dehydrogenase